MPTQYMELAGKLRALEWYRHYVTHRALKNSDVYFGQPPVLDYLAEHGASTQSDLVRALNVSPASVAVSVRRMQKSGLLTKTADETDLRCNRISLTEKGREQRDYIHACFDQIDEKLFAGFTKAELDALGGYLDRLCRNISEDVPKEKSIFKLMEEEFCNGGDPHGTTD